MAVFHLPRLDELHFGWQTGRRVGRAHPVTVRAVQQLHIAAIRVHGEQMHAVGTAGSVVPTGVENAAA